MANARAVLKEIRRRMKVDNLSQRTAAMDIGVTPAYLSLVLSGGKLPGPKVLAWIGWKQVRTVTHVYLPK